KHTMYPLEFRVASKQSELSWFEPIWNDSACLHFTLSIAKRYLDFVRGKKEDSKAALAHFGKTLSILQQRLASDNDPATSDSIILVVFGLTMAANALGEFGISLQHLKGLHTMITLRGGLSAFAGKRQLQAKICRQVASLPSSADLGVALGVGCKPLFSSDGFLWNSCVASQGNTSISRLNALDPDHLICDSALGHFLESLDTRLCLVWEGLSEFVRAANIATQCNFTIDGELYQEVMLSIHYRLIDLHFDSCNVNETIRLALLAFSSTLFLQWRGIKTRYEHLAQSLKSALSLLRHTTWAIPIHFSLWLYTIGAVSVFNEDEQAWFQPDLTEVLRAMRLKHWDEVRSSLKSILWVSALHDAPAKQIVEAALPVSQR
ncbi:hypothetical protein NA57DRAFT_42123, partial [Rhizodiscina lignyota]